MQIVHAVRPTMSVPAMIVDTDMSVDVDDVGALCVAHVLADRKEVRSGPRKIDPVCGGAHFSC